MNRGAGCFRKHTRGKPIPLWLLKICREASLGGQVLFWLCSSFAPNLNQLDHLFNMWFIKTSPNLLQVASLAEQWEDHSFFLKDFIYLFLERGEGKEKERERNINVWLYLVYHLLGTWPATQARALTGNWTGNPLVHRPALNPLSYTTQGWAGHSCQMHQERALSCPSWVVQLAEASSCIPEGCRFKYWSGCVWEATNQCFFLVSPSLSSPLFSPSLPSSL